MKEISASDIAAIIGAEQFGTPSHRPIRHLLTDSRKLLSSDDTVFFAIKTHSNDGHLYIEDLYARGVRLFVVQNLPDASHFSNAVFFKTPDVISALQSIAAYHRKMFSIPTLAITGSNGKTIVKEWLYHILHPFYQIVRSPRSFNSQLGVPLSVWHIQEHHQLGIFEAGISTTDEMCKLEAVIQPTIGIFTNLGEAHAEGFANNDEKLKEKFQLFKHVDTLVYCKDHPIVDQYITNYFSTHTISWGKNPNSDILLKQIEITEGNTSINVSFLGKPYSFTIPFTDPVAIENAMHCFAVCAVLRREGDVLERMNDLPSLSMRLELKEGQQQSIIVNDSYNADLTGILSAIEFLSSQKQNAAKAVILSDISGLSNNVEKAYKELSDFLLSKKITALYAVGPVFKQFADCFQHKPFKTSFFESTDKLIEQIHPSFFKNQVVLVKGARHFHFEQVSQLLETKTHKTRLEVNLSSVTYNLKTFRSLLKPSTKIMAMVKAFSYGAGSFEIANLLQLNRVDCIAVAYTDEGVELRNSGIRLPIMVMNAEADGFSNLVEYDLEPEVFSMDMAVKLDAFLRKEGIINFPIHLKLDTGMHRLGLDKYDLKSFLQHFSNANFLVKTVFTHLVAAENPLQDEFTSHQLDQFDEMRLEINTHLRYTPLYHASNTSAILRHPRAAYDMVRLGIGLYGVYSGNNHIDLNESVELKTTVAQIRRVKKGESVGYGRSSVLKNDSTIATIRIGYADGFPRNLGNGKGKVLINGKAYPTIGNICMDMTMIDLGNDSDILVDNEVLIFGRAYSIRHIAEQAGTIPYEIMTGISSRVPRVYLSE